MFYSKNCGHGFDLYVKCQKLSRSVLAPLTSEAELRDKLEELTGETYVLFVPDYCPICGKKVEEAEGISQGKERMFNPYDHRGVTEI